MITRKDAAALLSVSTTSVDKLVACGLLSPTRVAHLVMFAEESADGVHGIDRLLARGAADPTMPAVVVRLSAPPEENGDTHTGWHESWREPRKREAAEKWWPLRLDDGVERKLLLAEVSDWIVGAWWIRDKSYDVDARGWRFDLDYDGELWREHYLTRLPLGRGREALTLPR
ncbi:hypothetical protein [Paramicrobacterium agarici]|uniref:Helix-turn-helix protein n=1 Tax=Paramicrobacterium agarici TaxID=630514 RepID=A0A2A9DRI0_9MICO|nr:hypothetical protein [Microbacterium agarici]PFG29288.1 hypothetical protein ATJ78_0189 [Microbacterium agarici]